MVPSFVRSRNPSTVTDPKNANVYGNRILGSAKSSEGLDCVGFLMSVGFRGMCTWLNDVDALRPIGGAPGYGDQ